MKKPVRPFGAKYAKSKISTVDVVCPLRRLRAPTQRASSDSGTNMDAYPEYLAHFPGTNAASIYHAHYSAWSRHLRRFDQWGAYFAFALNSKSPAVVADQTDLSMLRLWRGACESATCEFFSLPKNHPHRHPVEKSFAAMVIPSVSASGVVHYHGWLRVPLDALDGQVSIPIHVQRRHHTIRGSRGLAHLVQRLVGSGGVFDHWTTSLWLHHEGDRAEPQAGVDSEPTADYLLKTSDGELRKWLCAEWVPYVVFKKITRRLPAFDTNVDGLGINTLHAKHHADRTRFGPDRQPE